MNFIGMYDMLIWTAILQFPTFHSLGNGIFIYNGSVEDSATAEISRSQVWQWMRHSQTLEDDGALITKSYVSSLVDEVMVQLTNELTGTDNTRLITASKVSFIIHSCTFTSWLTNRNLTRVCFGKDFRNVGF